MLNCRMIGIDLFAGAGGMTLGAKSQGIDVRVAVERDPFAVATYRRNNTEVDVFCGDVRHFTKFPRPKRGEAKILFGGPPCQGFSTSNQRTRSATNPTNWLFREFLRVAHQWEPTWIVFENVKGILETERARFFEMTIRQLQNLGYRLSHGVLNAADFGIPQNRNRLFVIGRRDGPPPALPTATSKRRLVVSEAIDDLPKLANGAAEDILPYSKLATSPYARRLRKNRSKCSGHLVTQNSPHVTARYPYIPPGGNWQSIPRRLMRNYTFESDYHTGVYYRLKSDEPSVVIGNYRKNMVVHPSQNRGLSVREAARIQSFPDSYGFCGSIGFQQQQVGNAVPPLLASAVFQCIMEATQ